MSKSRSRSYLRRVKTFDNETKKSKNVKQLVKGNRFLEDCSEWSSSCSSEQCDLKNLQSNQSKRICQAGKQLAKQERKRSGTSSNFSRVQTGIEDTQESMVKENESYKTDNQLEEEEPGHFQFQIGEVLNKKYKVIKHICDGTFGRVLEVEDIKDKQKRHYALKVIRPVERYIEAAKDEANILKQLPQSKNIISLIDTFYHKHHYCILTPLYGPSLASFIEMNGYQGYPISSIQSMVRQLIESLSVLHQIELTHTDLKPENILLKEKEYDVFDNDYKVPRSNNIILIDFGNSTYSDEHHSRIINTREYRAPEVLLQCCKWTEVSDMWAVGCIICELYNGECLFGGMHGEGEQDLGVLEHLIRVEKICGRVPAWMAYGAPQYLSNLVFQRQLRSNQNKPQLKKYLISNNSEVMKNINEMLVIKDIIDPAYVQLIDLLEKLLKVDPTERISAKDALEHPFFSVQFD